MRQVDSEKEEWKKVQGFEDYDVSTHGRVRKWVQFKGRDGKFRYPSFSISSNGSLKVGLVTTGRQTHGRQLAKLVYETFLGVELKEDLIFLDGDKTNCSLENLWTGQELVKTIKDNNIELKR